MWRRWMLCWMGVWRWGLESAGLAASAVTLRLVRCSGVPLLIPVCSCYIPLLLTFCFIFGLALPAYMLGFISFQI